MKFKGTYSAGTTYNVGDVVIYSQDNKVYHLQRPAKTGTAPHDTLYWGQVDQPLDEAVRLMADVLGLALKADEANETAISAVEGRLDRLEPALGGMETTIGLLYPSPDTLVLYSSSADSDKKFGITVDDSGEITATEIEEVEEEGEE